MANVIIIYTACCTGVPSIIMCVGKQEDGADAARAEVIVGGFHVRCCVVACMEGAMDSCILFSEHSFWFIAVE